MGKKKDALEPEGGWPKDGKGLKVPRVKGNSPIKKNRKKKYQKLCYLMSSTIQMGEKLADNSGLSFSQIVEFCIRREYKKPRKWDQDPSFETEDGIVTPTTDFSSTI